MRALTILTAAILTIALSTSAEARKRGLSLGSSPAPTVRPASSAATPAAAPTRSGTPILFVAPRTGTPMPAPAATAPGLGAAAGAVVGAGMASAASAGPRSIAPLAPVTPPVTRAGCPSENVIGSGAGFCALN